MLDDAVGFYEIYIVCGRTVLRYGIDSLAGVLSTQISWHIETTATAGTLYLLCGRDLTGLKDLYGKVMDSFSFTRNL